MKTRGLLVTKVGFQSKYLTLKIFLNSEVQFLRSATLEDIYRHYETGRKREGEDDDDKSEEDDYDHHAIGYGYQQKHSAKLGQLGQLGHLDSSGGYPYGAPAGGSFNYPGAASTGHATGLGLGAYATGHGNYGGNANHNSFGSTSGITSGI